MDRLRKPNSKQSLTRALLDRVAICEGPDLIVSRNIGIAIMRHFYPLMKIVTIFAATMLCIAFTFSACFGLYFYIREFFVSSGSDDKSLLFWYLPLLFMGVISVPLAGCAGLVACKTIKSLSGKEGPKGSVDMCKQPRK